MNVKESSIKPMVAHLLEMRNRLLQCILVVLFIFLGLFAYSNELYLYLSDPLVANLPLNSSMIATDVTSPFMTPFKLTLVLSIFAAMPFILYQVWAFVAPGLYKREKMIVVPLFLSSVLLFYAGMAFAYYLVFPLVFTFFTSVSPDGVLVMTDIRSYLDFVLKLFFAFGLSFQLPVVLSLLARVGIVDSQFLKDRRKYVVVIIFAAAALLTPPDPITQIGLAIPLLILYELSIFSVKFIENKNLEKTDA